MPEMADEAPRRSSFAVTSPGRILGDVNDAVPCCRAHCMVRSLGDGEVPLCRSWGTEVYRFTWDSSFDGDAVVRIARFSDEIMLSRVYRPSHFARTERSDASLTVADWARLQDALIAANFWVLEPHGEAHALDGAYWDDRGPAQGHFSRRASMEPAGCDP